MNIEHISISRKSVWDLCEQQYKYKYHLKLESEGPEPFYFSYGKIFHKIAEEYVRAKGKRKLRSVANDVLNGNILLEGEEAPELPPEYRNRLPEHLRYLQKLTDQIGTDGDLEVAFKYDLEPPNRKLISGVIDRRIVTDEGVFILDYKTTQRGNWRKDRQSIKKDLQLRMYARVTQLEFKVPASRIHAALYYVEGGNLISATFTEESLLAAEQEMLETYNQIVAMSPDAARGNVGDHCARCDYKKICPWLRVN